MTKYRSLFGMSLSVFLMMLGVGMVVAVLPQKVVTLTGSVSKVGYLASCFGISYVLLQLPMGNLADRVGIKPFLLLGYGLCTLAGILYCLAEDAAWIWLGRVLQGAGEAPIWALAPALLSIHYPAERGKAIGIYNASIHIGLTLGPLLGILLAGVWNGSGAFLFYTIACAVGGYPIHHLLEGSKSKAAPSYARVNFERLTSILTRGDTLCVFTGIMLYGGGYGIFLTVIPGFLVTAKGYGQVSLGVYFSLFYLAMTLSQCMAGPLSDKAGRRPFMIIGFVLGGFGLFLFPGAEPLLGLFFLVLASFGLGMFHTCSMASLSEQVSDSMKASISGAYYLFWGLGFFALPILIGKSGEALGFENAFSILASLLLGDALLIALYARMRNRSLESLM